MDGDFIMSAEEVQPVPKMLAGWCSHRGVHSHMIANIQLLFHHFWSTGKAEDLRTLSVRRWTHSRRQEP